VTVAVTTGVIITVNGRQIVIVKDGKITTETVTEIVVDNVYTVGFKI
jgi:hypothetical protein